MIGIGLFVWFVAYIAAEAVYISLLLIIVPAKAIFDIVQFLRRRRFLNRMRAEYPDLRDYLEYCDENPVAYRAFRKELKAETRRIQQGDPSAQTEAVLPPDGGPDRYGRHAA